MDDQLDLLGAGGSNLQDMYNFAVMDAVNEELGIAQQRVRPPALPRPALPYPHSALLSLFRLSAAAVG